VDELLVSVEEAARRLGIGRSAMYELLASAISEPASSENEARAQLHPDVRLTLDVLIAARRERHASEAEAGVNARFLPTADAVPSRVVGARRQAAELTKMGSDFPSPSESPKYSGGHSYPAPLNRRT
jgi:hypothetical protein